MTATAKLSPRFADAYLRVLEGLCSSSEFRHVALAVLQEVAEAVGCEAAGLRVRDEQGDYPYFVYEGFDRSFVERENRLCQRSADGRLARDDQGALVLDCMCGLVLRGMTAPEEAFFTRGGSFWTNSTTGLLAGAAMRELKLRTRNTCNVAGYESVALVPLHAGEETVGLLQVNSRQRNRFNADCLAFLEEVGQRIGGAVRTAWRLEELERAKGEIEEQRRGRESLVVLGEMASALAHEVKNPLAIMTLSASRLRRGLKGNAKLGPVAEQLVHSMSTFSETVTRATGAVAKPRLEFEPVRANEILEESARIVASRAADQNVQIAYELAEGLPQVAGDANFLKRAFLNLLANALDAMPSGGLLRLKAGAAGNGWVEVTIADTGPGIDLDQVEKLFKPFQTTKVEGAGLGLSIARRIAELHSGEVNLRRGTNGGAEAVVRLPASRP